MGSPLGAPCPFLRPALLPARLRPSPRSIALNSRRFKLRLRDQPILTPALIHLTLANVPATSMFSMWVTMMAACCPCTCGDGRAAQT